MKYVLTSYPHNVALQVTNYPFLPGRGSHKHMEWAGPFYWIWSIRGVVAVPFVRIGGGWGELNGKKALNSRSL